MRKSGECPKCGSDEIVKDVRVQNSATKDRGNLSFIIQTRPNAMLIKDPTIHPLLASICTDCGYVELYVGNPKKFYKDYLKSQGKSE